MSLQLVAQLFTAALLLILQIAVPLLLYVTFLFVANVGLLAEPEMVLFLALVFIGVSTATGSLRLLQAFIILGAAFWPTITALIAEGLHEHVRLHAS